MRRVLGKGLAQILGEQEESEVRQIPIDSIVPNPRQPRKSFDENSLRELADSIRRVGMVQPLLVRLLDKDHYELIAGERRWRAAKLAGLEFVPVVVRAAAGIESLELALIENLQREDISPLEAAEAYRVLIEQEGLTQEEVAQRVGKSRAAVANTLRLLRLPEKIRNSLEAGEISEGHARVLLQFDTESEMLQVHEKILEKKLTVREVEQLARKEQPKAIASRESKAKDPEIARIENLLSEALGTPVKIHRSGKSGSIEISFYSEEDLTRIVDLLTPRERL
ncbi:MAG TPA: ParB/RepB/Spo0J family partition protein [Fimbriimonadales bacterium]|nr:ParB/RepB/Spo0J family partition protein [Fimbriimonadales bacterium]